MFAVASETAKSRENLAVAYKRLLFRRLQPWDKNFYDPHRLQEWSGHIV